MMGLPPLLAGALQLRVTEPFPGVAVLSVGEPGTVSELEGALKATMLFGEPPGVPKPVGPL
jgi:hypothetical protein